MKEPSKIPKPQYGHQYYWLSPDKEWLEHQYWEQKKSISEIAREIGASYATVWRWMDVADIPRRSLSEADSLAQSGSKNPNWQGGCKAYFCNQARRVLKDARVLWICARCGRVEERLEVHHKDQDITNNKRENLCYLCCYCHWYTHHP